MSVDTHARAAALIFSGKVVSATTVLNQNIYKLVPTKIWRGQPADTLALKTGDGFSCSASLQVGQHYVLLSNSGDWLGLYDGTYTGAEATEASARLDQLFTHRRYRRGPVRP